MISPSGYFRGPLPNTDRTIEPRNDRGQRFGTGFNGVMVATPQGDGAWLSRALGKFRVDYSSELASTLVRWCSRQRPGIECGVAGTYAGGEAFDQQPGWCSD